jgi:hypothetical protein
MQFHNQVISGGLKSIGSVSNPMSGWMLNLDFLRSKDECAEAYRLFLKFKGRGYSIGKSRLLWLHAWINGNPLVEQFLDDNWESPYFSPFVSSDDSLNYLKKVFSDEVGELIFSSTDRSFISLSSTFREALRFSKYVSSYGSCIHINMSVANGKIESVFNLETNQKDEELRTFSNISDLATNSSFGLVDCPDHFDNDFKKTKRESESSIQEILINLHPSKISQIKSFVIAERDKREEREINSIRIENCRSLFSKSESDKSLFSNSLFSDSLFSDSLFSDSLFSDSLFSDSLSSDSDFDDDIDLRKVCKIRIDSTPIPIPPPNRSFINLH